MSKDNVKDIAKYIKKSVKWLQDQECGCCTYELDDRLGICVGWIPVEWFDRDADAIIRSKEDPGYAIAAGIKVYTSDDMRTDYEWINAPFNDKFVWDTTTLITKNENYESLASYFLGEFQEMENYSIDKQGRIQRAEIVKGCAI